MAMNGSGRMLCVRSSFVDAHELIGGIDVGRTVIHIGTLCQDVDRRKG